MRRRSLLLVLAPLALVVFLAVFLGPRLFEEDTPGEEEYRRLAEEAVSPGLVEVWGAWEGAEQEAFESVLDGYMEAFPGTDVVYVPLGDELEERIRGAVAERALPDLAILSGTRLAQELAEQGLLLPLHRIEQEADEPFAGPAAIVTGDQVVMFRYSQVSEDLMSYLVTEEAIETLTSFGLPTLARDVDPSIYPDPTMRVAVAGLRDAVDYRYDLSDLLPEELASVEGEGLLPLF